MSSMIAVPIVGRILAELGADVIKLENTDGDFWRYFSLLGEKQRQFSCMFEAANINKKSVVVDLKNNKDISIIKNMLKDADVFITNVR